MDPFVRKVLLRRRIEALLDRIDSEDRALRVLEADALSRALEYLRAGEIVLAHEVLDRLRNLTATSWSGYAVRAPTKPITTASLRETLASITD